MTERFERACRLLQLPPSGPFVIATSGGADSAAALLLMRHAAPHAKLIACYVDHGLRPAHSIARDVACVDRQARAAGAQMIVRRVDMGPSSAGSPEERARAARYEALLAVARDSGAAFVVTGHQQDDLCETSLLALVRGAGIDGVAAMRPLRALGPGVALARPLMWATKAQCTDLARTAGMPISQDETNRDLRIPRNAVRALVAALERALPGASRTIARSATLLADDKALLERMSAAAWQSARIGDANELSSAALRRMPVALVRRVIRHALAASGAGRRDFSFEHCNAIAQAIRRGRGGSYHAGVARVVLSAGKLVVESSGPLGVRPFAPVAIDLARLPRQVVTPLGRLSLKPRRTKGNVGASARAGHPAPGTASAVQQLDADALRGAGTIEIRMPRPGDVCVPTGRSRPVSLARFLAKSGVPKPRRATAALLCAGGRIAAVLGLRVMEPFKPKQRSTVLEVGWRATDI